MNSRIFFSTHGDISFHQWFGTVKVIFQSEKITWDHFCLTMSNHNFLNLVSISRNLYGIFKIFVYQKFLNFFFEKISLVSDNQPSYLLHFLIHSKPLLLNIKKHKYLVWILLLLYIIPHLFLLLFLYFYSYIINIFKY
jgi:hypothetical protein